MVISNGNVADADEVMNAMGSLFHTEAQNLFNATYIGFDSRINKDGLLPTNNLDYDVFLTDTMTATGDIDYDATNDVYWGPSDMEVAEYVTYDEFETGTIDTALWTTTIGTYGAASESGGELHLSNSVSADASSGTQVVSDENVWTYGDTYYGLWIGEMSGTVKQDVGGTSTYRVTVGTQVVYEETRPGPYGLTAWGPSNIQVINFGSFGYYRASDTGAWTYSTTLGTGIVTILVVTGRKNSGTNSTGSINVGYVRRNTFATAIASSTNYIISDTVTPSSTCTNSMSVWNDTLTIGTSDFSVAYDGTNYSSATDATILRNANTGTSLKNKWTLSGIGYLSEYATKYNLY